MVQAAMKKVKGFEGGHQTLSLIEWKRIVEVGIVGRGYTMPFPERPNRTVMGCVIGVYCSF